MRRPPTSTRIPADGPQQQRIPFLFVLPSRDDLYDCRLVFHLSGGLALLCDQANSEFANGYAGVFAVQAGVKTRTGLQLKHVLQVVERPNACESPVEVTYYGLGR